MNLLKTLIKNTKYESKWFIKENSWCVYFYSNKSVQHRQTKFREKNGDVNKKYHILQI